MDNMNEKESLVASGRCSLSDRAQSLMSVF